MFQNCGKKKILTDLTLLFGKIILFVVVEIDCQTDGKWPVWLQKGSDSG